MIFISILVREYFGSFFSVCFLNKRRDETTDEKKIATALLSSPRNFTNKEIIIIKKETGVDILWRFSRRIYFYIKYDESAESKNRKIFLMFFSSSNCGSGENEVNESARRVARRLQSAAPRHSKSKVTALARDPESRDDR